MTLAERNQEIERVIFRGIRYWLDRMEEDCRKIEESERGSSAQEIAREFKHQHFSKALAVYSVGIQLDVVHEGDFPSLD